MQTKVSTRGQVVLPGPLRRRLDIRTGDCLDANVENGCIILTPRSKRQHRVKFVTDPVTGLPALSAGSTAPALTSKEVEEILENFPD
ncbi:MAG: AbrB/MazE/SpoVT family DNA-binding domain-containing protein [Candidatus Sulfotelmatobacter sp.]